MKISLLLCWLGYHKVSKAQLFWPHQATCDRCGRTVMMDTRGEFFDLRLSGSSGTDSNSSIELYTALQSAFVPEQSPKASLPRFIQVREGDNIKSVPVSYMWKDVLQPGNFFKELTGQSLSLDEHRLQKMLDTVLKYLANGNPIPIPYRDHDESKNAGFVVDARISNGRLELLHQFVGQGMVEHALRNHVSVLIKPTHKDPKGNEYEDCIAHSSLTEEPVIIGQQSWAPLAASRGRPDNAPLYLHAASRSPNMDFSKLKKLLGLADNATDQEALDAAIAKFGTIEQAQQALAQKTTECTTLSTKVTALQSELDTKKQEVVTLSQRANPIKPTANEMYLSSRVLREERDKAIGGKAINAATADKVIQRYCGDTKLQDISLSRAVGDTDIALLQGMNKAIEFFENVQGNTPAPPDGETTGAQTRTDTRNDTQTQQAAAAATAAAATSGAGAGGQQMPKTIGDVVDGSMSRQYNASKIKLPNARGVPVATAGK